MKNRTLAEIEASAVVLHKGLAPLIEIQKDDIKNYKEKYKNMQKHFLRSSKSSDFYDPMLNGVVYADGVHEFSKWYNKDNLDYELPKAFGFILSVIDYGVLRIPPDNESYEEIVNALKYNLGLFKRVLKRRNDIKSVIKAHWTRLSTIRELQPQKQLLEELESLF